MRRLILASLLGFGAAAAAAPLESHADLAGGSYSVAVSGFLCTVCAKAVSAEFSELPAVEKATVDWDRGLLVLTIRSGSYLSFAQLRRALKRASARANLGTRFEVESIRYRP